MFICIIFSLMILTLCSGAGIYFWVAKKKTMTACLLITTGITASLVLFFSLTLIIDALWLMAIPASTLFLAFLAENNLKWGENVLTSFLHVIGILLIIAIFFVNTYIPTRYMHNITVHYEISLENNEVKINHDAEDLTEIIQDFLENEALNMYENSIFESSGKVDVAYICSYPLLFNTHNILCSCTEAIICSICKKHICYELIIEE